jgi:hypothetical protein
LEHGLEVASGVGMDRGGKGIAIKEFEWVGWRGRTFNRDIGRMRLAAIMSRGQAKGLPASGHRTKNQKIAARPTSRF